MALACGIVGLPNVGKSTLFNALTAAGIEASNYPFCTIEPNTGVVFVPDPRLDRICELLEPNRRVPTTMEFVDIAGLVKGASQGEGLGNQFLSHIRQVTAIVHVVRCFEDDQVIHVDGSVDPLRDIDIIHTELCLADLDTVSKALDKNQRLVKTGKKDVIEKVSVYEVLKSALEKGQAVRSLTFSDAQIPHVRELMLLTHKPVLYVCNVAESEIGGKNTWFQRVKAFAATEGSQAIDISAKVESEIAELPPPERVAFLKELGLSESGLDHMIRASYTLLSLITFFTAGKTECRAWTIRQGTKAPGAAGAIHSDFERGFIRAEVYPFEALNELGSEAAVKAKGLLRAEGKEYVMKDGDIVHFLFNV